MVNELTVPLQGLPTPYLPPRVAALVRLMGGTVDHPGQPTRYHMAVGVELPEPIREEARSLLSTLSSMLNPETEFAGQTAYNARLGIVTTLILGLANAGTTEESANARFDLFEVALHDIPAWAVAAGAARWVRRQVPADIDKNPNFAFPPGPGVLRGLALLEMEPYQRSVGDLKKLVACISIERAMDPRPLDPPKTMLGETVVPKLRKM